MGPKRMPKGKDVLLSGKLSYVPLGEVLRSLSRSFQHGVVEVRGSEVSGRVFAAKGGIDLASTWDDATLRRRLASSGLVGDSQLADVESGKVGLDAVADTDTVIELLREVSVESIYRLETGGESFEVFGYRRSPYASPTVFELENLLSDAGRRRAEWEEVSQVVGDLGAVLRLSRDLEEDITIGRDSWRAIARLDAGSTVRSVAEELGTTEFWVARVVADLARRGLVIIGEGDFPPRKAPVFVEEPVIEEPGAVPEEPSPLPTEPVFREAAPEEPSPAPEEPVAVEPEAEQGPEEAVAVEPEAEQGPEEEEDAEAFLARVFSVLDSDEHETLLHRRRVGGSPDERTRPDDGH